MHRLNLTVATAALVTFATTALAAPTRDPGDLERRSEVGPERPSPQQQEDGPREARFDGSHPSKPAPQDRLDTDHPRAEPPVPVGGNDERILDEMHLLPWGHQQSRILDETHPSSGGDPARMERVPVTGIAPEPPLVYPNPSMGRVSVEAGSTRMSVDVYDVSGRRVASFAGTGGRADWDGRDISGRVVPAGVYFARVSADGASAETVRLVRR